jgi:capsular exopolysaccharide synthesis family protein
MSRFFNETQKAHNSPNLAAESARLDIVSVVDAIKQSEMSSSAPTAVSYAKLRQIRIEAATKDLVTSLKIDTPSAYALVEAHRTLRTRTMRLLSSKGIHSIMLTSAVPGEGKTTTALNLALSCAQLRDKRILLVDSDLRSRGLTRLLAIPEGLGLCDVLSGKALNEEAVLTTEYENHLSIVSAGSTCEQPAELLAGRRWFEFVEWSHRYYDVIIIDAPPIRSLADAELISAACDGVLFVLRAFSTPREIVRQCGNRIDKKKLIGLVFNGVPHNSEDRHYYDVASSGYRDGNSKCQERRTL